MNAMANVLQLERELMMNEDDFSKQSTEEQKSDHTPRVQHHGHSGGSSVVGAAVAVTVATTISINTHGTLPHNTSGFCHLTDVSLVLELQQP